MIRDKIDVHDALIRVVALPGKRHLTVNTPPVCIPRSSVCAGIKKDSDPGEFVGKPLVSFQKRENELW
jgi:hypothetical protein